MSRSAADSCACGLAVAGAPAAAPTRLQRAVFAVECTTRPGALGGKPLDVCPPAPALRRENNTGRFPRGLSLMLRSMAGEPDKCARCCLHSLVGSTAA